MTEWLLYPCVCVKHYKAMQQLTKLGSFTDKFDSLESLILLSCILLQAYSTCTVCAHYSYLELETPKIAAYTLFASQP